MEAIHKASFLSTQSIAVGLLVLVFIAVISALASIQHPPFPSKSPPRLSGLPLLGRIDTLTKPWEMFQRGVSASRTGNFSFNLGQYQAVGVSSATARDTFFTHPQLAPGAGYGVIFGEGQDDALRAKNEKIALQKMKGIMTTERLRRAIPTMMADVNARLDELGSSGTRNPFKVIQKIVFQLTIRMVGADEIADDPKLRAQVLDVVEVTDNGHALATFLFPWLPLPAVLRKMWSSITMYRIIRRVARERERTGRRGEDTLQYLLDMGDSIQTIVEFTFGGLFAGLGNSGGTAAWLLCHLAAHPEWMAKVRAEIVQLGAKYAPIQDRQATVTKQLLSVPLEAWETELPILELCVRESLRMYLQAPMMRKNMSSEQIIIDGDEVVSPGAVMLFYTGAVMMNPGIYKDPHVWDPTRFYPDRAEDKSGQHVYVGWGCGKHPCRGMRFAKLEQSIIAAFFVTRFEYDLLDSTGQKVDSTAPPQPGPRGFQITKQPDFALKYKAV
ncbi:hypothetical protein FRB94_014338 [Tulasnella sp. JGI-2019a]|nr:hypothetical protein FRB93_008634 [Tulasnella sp. JGI-2019a]KAG9007483.1 hypothetical protein FRB94_014338 [Tulasnella sp. JGI-2019a]